MSAFLGQNLVRPQRIPGGLLLAAFLVRVAFGLIFTDLGSEHYSEYGEIVKNLHAGFGYSLFHKSGPEVNLWFSPTDRPFPSAYMPPGYVAFLYPFFWIGDVALRNIALVVMQSLLAVLSIAALYVFTRKAFGEGTALLAAGMGALLPEFVYASSSFGPVALYHLGQIAILLYLGQFSSLTTGRAVMAGALFAATVFLRSEFIFFALIVLAIEAVRGSHRIALVVATTTVLFLIPWTIRNVIALESIVPLTTNAGLNLYRGHNPVGIGSWGDESAQRELSVLEPGSDFEVRMQRMYSDHATSRIAADPFTAFTNGFVKLFHLWVLNPNDERSDHPMYLYPWLLVLGLGMIGFWKSRSWNSFRHLYLFLICSSVIAFVFFALPRYQTMMKIAILPFSAHGVMVLYSTLRKPHNPPA